MIGIVDNQNVVILAQLACPASIETLLYQVPAGFRSFIAELSVCNRSGVSTSFRFSISKLGAPTVVHDYFYFGTPINANDTFASEIQVTLNPFDAVRVFTPSANLTFALMGVP